MIDYFNGYDNFTPESTVIPKLYWNSYSQEQRIWTLCHEVAKMIKYAQLTTDKLNDVISVINALETELADLVNDDVKAEIERLVTSGEFAEMVQAAIDNFEGRIATVENVAAENAKNRHYTNFASFGGVGDGATDNAQKFYDAFEYCANNNTTLYIPKGNYYVSRTLETTVPMCGDGPGVTIITADNGYDIIRCGSVDDVAFGVILEQMTVTRKTLTWKTDGYAGIKICAGSYLIDSVCSAYSAISFISESLPNYNNHDLYNTKDVREIRNCSAYGGYIGFQVLNQDSFMSNCTSGSFNYTCFQLAGVTGAGFHAWSYGKYAIKFDNSCTLSAVQIESDASTGNYKSSVYCEAANATVTMNGVYIWAINNQDAVYWDALFFFKNGARLNANGVTIRYPFGKNVNKVCPPLFIGQNGSFAQIIGTISEFDSLMGDYWITGSAMVAIACSHDDYTKLATTTAKQAFLVNTGTNGCGISTIAVR